MSRVKSLYEAAKGASETLHCFDDAEVDLIKTGIGPVDEKIGGVFPGQGGVLGMGEGVGKSSTILTAAMASPDPTGIIFVEDTEDVVGSRALAASSGVDSLRMRTKRYADGDLERLEEGLGRLHDAGGVWVVSHPGASIERVCEYVSELGELGCRLIWLDYAQKLRGISENRAVEVATGYTKFQSACFEVDAAFMVASQFKRTLDPERRPRRGDLKETGDLENEARIIVLGWRDKDDRSVNHYVLDKSTVGGEGITWAMKRDESGTLRELDPFREEFA